jgi:hypothetical protein
MTIVGDLEKDLIYFGRVNVNIPIFMCRQCGGWRQFVAHATGAQNEAKTQ